MSKKPDVKDLIQQRESLYGPSWAAHGQCQKPITHLLDNLQQKYPPIVWPWHAIFNKLLRALTSPMKRDHWVDIQGYAQLILDMLDGLEEEQHPDEEESEDKSSKE